jgi:hypothetical protein
MYWDLQQGTVGLRGRSWGVIGLLVKVVELCDWVGSGAHLRCRYSGSKIGASKLNVNLLGDKLNPHSVCFLQSTGR